MGKVLPWTRQKKQNYRIKKCKCNKKKSLFRLRTWKVLNIEKYHTSILIIYIWIATQYTWVQMDILWIFYIPGEITQPVICGGLKGVVE